MRKHTTRVRQNAVIRFRDSHGRLVAVIKPLAAGVTRMDITVPRDIAIEHAGMPAPAPADAPSTDGGGA